MNPPTVITKVTGHVAARQTADLRYIDDTISRPHRASMFRPKAIRHLLRPHRIIVVVVIRWRR
jgi:hypothetical protein